MTGPEVEAMYFSPLMFFFYLSTVMVIMGLVYQYLWTKKCRLFVKVLVVKPDGDTSTEYALKEGNHVRLINPSDENKTVRLWPINKVCAIEMLYPGDGFIPIFLQKKIKTVIVDEEDWEPLLNRGAYFEKVASPDVVKALRTVIKSMDEQSKVAKTLEALTNDLTTAPTREMIANPAILGDLEGSGILKALATVGNDFLDILKSVDMKLGRVGGLNPIVVYIGLGLNTILVAFAVYKIVEITTALGIGGGG